MGTKIKHKFVRKYLKNGSIYLEWTTFSENEQHAYDTGLTTGYTGRKDRGNNKFGEEWTDLNSKGVSLREIGKMYGVAHHTVKRTIIKYAEEQEV